MPEEPRYDLVLPDETDLAELDSAELAELPPLGEIVEDEPAPKVVVLRQVVQPVTVVLQTINVVVQAPQTRFVARHGSYVAAGLVVASRRRRRRRTLTAEMAHLAAARGELDKAVEWAKQDHEQAHERAERRRRAWESAGRLLHPQTLKGIAIFTAVAVALLVMTGWMRYLVGLYHLVSAVAAFAWDVRYGVPAVVLLWLWHLGRTAGSLAPKWAQASAAADVDTVVDERAVTRALANQRFPQVKEYLAKGHPMQFVVPCRTDGRGTYCEVRLPGGLPASEIAKQPRRERLAASLYRLPKETYPSTGSDASILKLWIADKGALDEGAGPYPLLGEGFTDVFKGLPFGRILRGDPSRVTVIGRNSIIGGMPEQGKSNASRVIGAGYALDVTTEMRIYVPDTNFDFERFGPRCSSYVMGSEDEHVERILGELEELHHELQVRGQILVDREAEEVTRELAHAGIGLHPVWVLLEEAHVCIQHRKYGKAFIRLLPEIVKLDRKRAVHVTVSTQAPTKDSMPRDVTRNCTVGVAFAVGDHVANDALLGQGAYKGGHRATELIPGVDQGTALCKGFGGEARSEVVQLHRVSGRADDDQVTPLVNRALAELGRQGRPVPGTSRGPVAIAYRDLLDDLGEVLRHRSGKVRVSELPDLLHNLAPSWTPYAGLTVARLREQLLGEGVRTTNPGNVPTLDLDDLAAAVAERERVS